MTLLGDRSTLAWEFAPPVVEGAPTLRPLAWCGLRLWVGSALVWAADDDAFVEWTWIDLVEHLARSRIAIGWEETVPFGLRSTHPERLRQRSLVRSVAGRTSDEVEAEVHAWQHRHNLAAGLHGIWLPAVWLQPSGTQMRVITGERAIHLERHDALHLLEQVVDHLVRQADPAHPRTAQAVAWWPPPPYPAPYTSCRS